MFLPRSNRQISQHKEEYGNSEKRVADEKSRDIFFVAAYRSMGWASAAWIDEVTGKVQILNEEFAKEDVNFDTAEAAQSRKGVLQAKEQAILMMADAVEAASRSLPEYNR